MGKIIKNLMLSFSHIYFFSSPIQQFLEYSGALHFQVLPKVAMEKPKSNIGDCDVCCDTTQLCGLACNHLACDTCWKSYLETKVIMREGCLKFGPEAFFVKKGLFIS